MQIPVIILRPVTKIVQSPLSRRSQTCHQLAQQRKVAIPTPPRSSRMPTSPSRRCGGRRSAPYARGAPAAAPIADANRARGCRSRPRRAASATALHSPRRSKTASAASMRVRTTCRAGFQPRHHRRKIPAASAADVPFDPASNGGYRRNTMRPRQGFVGADEARLTREARPPRLELRPRPPASATTSRRLNSI